MSRPRPKSIQLRRYGTCDSCRRPAKIKHECLTCEKKGDEPFTTRACNRHRQKAEEDIRRHAMVKHPSNLLALSLAALKGEDVW